MCLTPVRLKNGTHVACRGCRICRSNRLNDLVGRCIAEQAVSDEVFAVTLTYGGGDIPAATILYYRHVQLMLKLLRRDGYCVRYICAGEYGTEKGRAHWHIILFFDGKGPDVQIEANVQWKYWPHGHCYFQHPDYRGFRYALKYALKSESSGPAVKSVSMSKKPPLGHAFFMQLASDLVKKRLPVHSPEYSFAHIHDRNDRARRYWLQGRMREMFLERYCELWFEAYGVEPPWTDFLLEKYLDPIARREMAHDTGILVRDLDAKRPKGGVYVDPSEYSDPFLAGDRRSLGFFLFPDDPNIIISIYSDGSADFDIGDEKCVIAESEWSRGMLSGVTDLTASQMQQACQWLAVKMEAYRRDRDYRLRKLRPQ